MVFHVYFEFEFEFDFVSCIKRKMLSWGPPVVSSSVDKVKKEI